jgi:hypothetical protein
MRALTFDYKGQLFGRTGARLNHLCRSLQRTRQICSLCRGKSNRQCLHHASKLRLILWRVLCPCVVAYRHRQPLRNDLKIKARNRMDNNSTLCFSHFLPRRSFR